MFVFHILKQSIIRRKIIIEQQGVSMEQILIHKYVKI